jgi:hypothetical protein
MHIRPHKPREPCHQKQQQPDTRPAQAHVRPAPVCRLTSRSAGIFGETHPSVFIEQFGGLMSGQVPSDPLLLIQPDDPGILPHHAFVEDPARENIEVLLFEGHEVTVADLSYPGDRIQRNPAKLPLLPQCIAEIPHTLHPSADLCRHSHHKAAPLSGQKAIRVALWFVSATDSFELLERAPVASYFFNFATLGSIRRIA